MELHSLPLSRVRNRAGPGTGGILGEGRHTTCRRSSWDWSPSLTPEPGLLVWAFLTLLIGKTTLYSSGGCGSDLEVLCTFWCKEHFSGVNSTGPTVLESVSQPQPCSSHQPSHLTSQALTDTPGKGSALRQMYGAFFSTNAIATAWMSAPSTSAPSLFAGLRVLASTMSSAGRRACQRILECAHCSLALGSPA